MSTETEYLGFYMLDLAEVARLGLHLELSSLTESDAVMASMFALASEHLYDLQAQGTITVEHLTEAEKILDYYHMKAATAAQIYT